MSMAELSLIHGEIASIPLPPVRTGHIPGQPLHRIQEVRRQQEMSLRTAARQLGSDVRSVRAQEQSTTDLRLSDLYRWQAVLDVPISELLVEADDSLSRDVGERAQLVRIMKTATSILENAENAPLRRMAENLVEQLAQLMPELKEVGGWHSVGQRRGVDELGRIAQQPFDTNYVSFGDGGE